MIALVSRARLQLSVPAAVYRQFSSHGGGIDYDSFLSRSARARVPSPIRCTPALLLLPALSRTEAEHSPP